MPEIPDVFDNLANGNAPLSVAASDMAARRRPVLAQLQKAYYGCFGGRGRLRRKRKIVRAMSAAITEPTSATPSSAPTTARVIPQGLCMARMLALSGHIQVMPPFCMPAMSSLAPLSAGWLSLAFAAVSLLPAFSPLSLG